MSVQREMKAGRCMLSRMGKDDVGVLKEIFANAETRRYLPELYTLIVADDGIAGFIYAFESLAEKDEGCLWGIRCDDCLVGFVAIMDLSFEPSLFYAMHPDSRQRGYMKEAIAAVVGYLRRERLWRSVSTEVYKENVISVNILQQMGFVACREDGDKVYLSKMLAL